MVDFEYLPLLPEGSVCAGIAELRTVAINGASTIDLAQSSLHLGEFETHFFGLLVGQSGNGALVDWSGRCETEIGGRFCNVKFEQLETVLVGHCPSCTLVDPHRVSCETALFF